MTEQFDVTAYLCSILISGVEASDQPPNAPTPIEVNPGIPKPFLGVPFENIVGTSGVKGIRSDHGMGTGQLVDITNCGFNPGYTNAPWTITRIDDSSFSLNGAVWSSFHFGFDEVSFGDVTPRADGQITARMMSASLGYKPGFIQAYMASTVNESANLHACELDDNLRLTLEVDAWGRLHYCGIHYKSPQGFCDWEKVMVLAEHYGLIAEHGMLSDVVGPIPSSKEGVLAALQLDLYRQSYLLVPGEMVSLVWSFKSGPSLHFPVKYFATKCFTGGRIVSISGDSKDPSTTYTVRIEGQERSGIKSSDFFSYGIGDWVFIYKETGCAEDYSSEVGPGTVHETPYFELSVPQYSGNGIIVPYKFGSVGPSWN